MSIPVEGHVIVVGAGGNIGSHLVAHLVRMLGVRWITLVDRDVYEAKNLVSQDITRRDVGHPKASVQAARLRRINPAVGVSAIDDAVEAVPLGRLRGAVLLACVDSRAARRSINTMAWRLGMPWIDAGVRREGLLARMNVYVPGAGQPCLECAWDARDYQALEQAYPCGAGSAPAATNAPSALGALAASLQALECQKLLAGEREDLAVGKQVTISAVGHQHYVTRFAANPACRFDHATWDVERLQPGPAQVTLAQAFELGRKSLATDEPLRLQVTNQVFATQLWCVNCGQVRSVGLRLLGRLRPRERDCADCGRRTRPGGFDVLEWLSDGELAPAVHRATLRRLGLRRGDLFTVAGGTRAAHFQLGAEQ